MLLAADTAVARERTPPAVRAWVSTVIAGILDRADRAPRTPTGARGSGTVGVRVEIAADGFVNRVDVERSSGSAELDQRARALIRSAGPFRPPPAPLLTRAGTTDLSFPLRLRR